jgi:molybdate transport repressor ModE-like protein
MAVDARRLLLLRTVLRAGSMSAAARELGMTQPAVSQQLAVLERETGVPLVLRATTGVRATEAGAVLLRRAEAVAGELHRAGEEMLAFLRLRRGVVRLAAYPTAAATLVPRAAAALRAAEPEVDLVLLEAEPPEATALVVAGEADVALVFRYAAAPDDGLVTLDLAAEPVDPVVPAGTEPPADVADLAGVTWVAGCERCRAHLVDVCAAHGFVPRIAHTTDDSVVVQNLVAAGLGWSVLPRGALEAFRHRGVATVPGLFGRRRVGIAYAPGAEAVPATGALLRELVAAAGSPPAAMSR